MIELPLPPTGNLYWRRGRGGIIYKTREATAFKQEVGWLLVKQEPVAGPVSVTVNVYVNNRNRDLDNCLKVLFDALQGYVYKNDSQIKEIHAYWNFDKEKPRVELEWKTL